jgi:hypothetical protein
LSQNQLPTHGTVGTYERPATVETLKTVK